MQVIILRQQGLTFRRGPVQEFPQTARPPVFGQLPILKAQFRSVPQFPPTPPDPPVSLQAVKTASSGLNSTLVKLGFL